MGSFQSSELTLPETLGQHVERQYHQLQRRQRGFLTLFEVAAMRPTKELPADPADIATLFALDRKKTGKISLQDLTVFATVQRTLLSYLSKTQPLELAARSWTMKHFLNAIQGKLEHSEPYESNNDTNDEKDDTPREQSMDVTKEDVSVMQCAPSDCQGVDGITDWFCKAINVATCELEAEKDGIPYDEVKNEALSEKASRTVHPVAAQFCFQILQIPLPEMSEGDETCGSPVAVTGNCSPINTHRVLGGSSAEINLCQRIALHHFKTWNDVRSLVKGFLEGIVESCEGI